MTVSTMSGQGKRQARSRMQAARPRACVPQAWEAHGNYTRGPSWAAVVAVPRTGQQGSRADVLHLHPKEGTMKRKEWTLLAIASAQGESLSPVQLQKTLFLLGRVYPSEVGPDFHRFQPYNYGPFSPTVYHDASQLESDGLVCILRHSGRSWVEYAATPKGLAQGEELEKMAPEPVASYLKAVVGWARSLSFPQLVRAIYKMDPAQRANSVFQG